ncbi:hypothetical protein [Parafannyhessea umbonata]|uniref:Uncharacterized protein n=1 Tax=Parafannyhessea umbonata TaxID=604330 RepID=A0A1H1NYC2_9ACTN|nr:hypothetical protein [Parafannyhessea umbonata]SDS03775.1 hypothetical protein SAMN04489857_2024 [Parafannyhessea umbonata]
MLRNNRTHARTCGDCRFMTERMGVLRTHCECLEPSQSGRRVGEKDAACPLFAGHMVKPGPSLAELLGADTRRAVGELTSEKPARTGRRGTGTTGAAAAAGAPANADAAPATADEADLAALEARAQAAEARAQALEAKAALAEARARASRGGRASGR